jgi:colicin import membrane protein
MPAGQAFPLITAFLFISPHIRNEKKSLTSTRKVIVMTSNPPGDQVPGACVAGVCKRPGCGTALPVQDRGRTRQFCSTECARRYHNDARIPAPPAADSPADPLAALEGVIRQAAVLIRTARQQAASLDPARVRAQVAEAEAARRHAEAAAVTAAARTAEAETEALALAEALEAAREDVRAAQTATAAARREAEAAAAGLEQARRDAASQIAAAQAEAAGQARAARTEAARAVRERDDAIEAARRADAETGRARQAEADARAETDRARADAARERDTLRDQHQAQLDAVAALTAAERARAERAEHLLEAERADRRHLTTALTAPASPANANANGNGNGNGNGKLARAAAGKAGQP